MSQGHATKGLMSLGITAPANGTTEIKRFAISGDNRLNMRIDCILGKMAISGTSTLKLQQSSGLELWTDVKSTSSLSASTDKTVTPDYTTGQFTSTSHGYSDGALVVLNSSGTVPGGLESGLKYYVRVIDANTFQLSVHQPAGSLPASFSDNGSGTITTTLCTLVSIALNVEVSGDQAVMPLHPTARLLAITGASDTVQVMDIRFGQPY